MAWRCVREGRDSALPADAAALVLIASGVTAGCYDLLGMHDPVAIVVFVSTWLSGAVTRVGALRRGEYQPMRVNTQNGRTIGLMIAAGTLPWFGVAWLRAAYPWGAVWDPVVFPLPVQACGIALAVAAFAKPCIRRIGGYPPGSREFSLLLDGLLPASAIFLVSGSPFVGVVSCLWLAVLLARHTEVEPSEPEVAISTQPGLVPAS